MILERLQLHCFRNYQAVTVTFAPGGAYITGANGSGKTNLLEAIYYVANFTSFRTTRREELQSWGAPRGVIRATLTERQTGRQNELVVYLQQQRRRLLLNGKEVRDLRHIARCFAAVAFHPGTVQVIKGSPAARRHLIDRGILSLHPACVQVYQEFQRALRQRNALLRTASKGSAAAYAVWTERFIVAAARLMWLRQEYIARLNRTLAVLLPQLGEDLGSMTLAYRSVRVAECLSHTERETQLRAYLQDEAQRLRRAEEAMGQTLFGPQRDDVLIRLRDKASREYASQGEQRLAAFLLVAALAINMREQRGYSPVVLLDDVVSELDARHRKVVFDFLKTYPFQVFITDVEERPLYRSLGPLSSLQVQCRNGWAELHSDGTSTAIRDGQCIQEGGQEEQDEQL